jgi:hypothetical protein
VSFGALAYLAFGAALVALFAWIAVHYFRKERKAKVEAPKYKMLDDDDR